MNYQFELKELPFEGFKSGKKKIETRTKVPHNMTAYELIEKGDTIIFENKVTSEKMESEVSGIRHYPNVVSLLDSEGQENVMSYNCSRQEAIDSYNELNGYTEGIKEYGIWAIEVKII